MTIFFFRKYFPVCRMTDGNLTQRLVFLDFAFGLSFLQQAEHKSFQRAAWCPSLMQRGCVVGWGLGGRLGSCRGTMVHHLLSCCFIQCLVQVGRGLTPASQTKPLVGKVVMVLHPRGCSEPLSP